MADRMLWLITYDKSTIYVQLVIEIELSKCAFIH